MIHPQALVDPQARIADGVTIGAFSIIEKNVVIGRNTWIGPFVTVRANTTIGESNRIYQYCSIGESPQFLGYNDEPTSLVVGDRNVIREYCTLNRGTPAHHDDSTASQPQLGGETRIGNDNFLMAYVHIAHDCKVSNHTIFANCASLAGHVDVGDYAILGGFTLVHQFCRVGAHAITGIGSVCLQDLPPFVVAAGNTAKPHGINIKGLRRRQFDNETIAELRRAYRHLYRSRLDLRSAIVKLQQEFADNEQVEHFVRFLQSSERGIIR